MSMADLIDKMVIMDWGGPTKHRPNLVDEENLRDRVRMLEQLVEAVVAENAELKEELLCLQNRLDKLSKK
jgi:hypothetical protein